MKPSDYYRTHRQDWAEKGDTVITCYSYSGETFKIGDLVRLNKGKKILVIRTIERSGSVTLEYRHSGDIKDSHIHNLVKVENRWGDLTGITPSNTIEEQPMNNYGNQSHDQIFEALIDKQYKTVAVAIPSRHGSGSFRAPVDMELEVGDKVLLSIGPKDHVEIEVGTIASVHKDKCQKAVAWVIQKVDIQAHEERTAQWKTLYEGIKEAEMEKKRAILAEGYESELAKYAPEAAQVLASFNTPKLERKDA